MPCKVWHEITYPFSNFNSAIIEVWEWISNHIPYFSGHVITYPCWDWSQSILVKGAMKLGLICINPLKFPSTDIILLAPQFQAQVSCTPMTILVTITPEYPHDVANMMISGQTLEGFQWQIISIKLEISNIWCKKDHENMSINSLMEVTPTHLVCIHAGCLQWQLLSMTM